MISFTYNLRGFILWAASVRQISLIELMNRNALRFGHFGDAYFSAQGREDELNFSESRPVSLAENILKDMVVDGHVCCMEWHSTFWLWRGHLRNGVIQGFFHPRLYVISLIWWIRRTSYKNNSSAIPPPSVGLFRVCMLWGWAYGITVRVQWQLIRNNQQILLISHCAC